MVGQPSIRVYGPVPDLKFTHISSEVIFAMTGEILLLGSPLPNTIAFVGIFMAFSGLALFIRFQEIVK